MPQLAEGEFDLFITSDQNVRYQQNLSGRRIAILELSTNKLGRIESAADLIRESFGGLKFRKFGESSLGGDGSATGKLRGSASIIRFNASTISATLLLIANESHC